MSKQWALYNEIDEFAAAWLEQLIARGHIAPGIVDRRSIAEIRPDDLRGFRQVHFFAGIGVWSHALRCAGVSDDTPIWTGSCPCQPFSAAGKGAGMDDERHLWPHFHHLIRECAPPIVLGEQVASKDGLGWLDLVQADMEGTGYAFGAVDTCAAGFGAPHIRQRLYWFAKRMGDGLGTGLEGFEQRSFAEVGQWEGALRPVATAGGIEWVADHHHHGCEPGTRRRSLQEGCDAQHGVSAGGLAVPADFRRQDGKPGDAGREGCAAEGSRELAWDWELSEPHPRATGGMEHANGSGTGAQPGDHREGSKTPTGGMRADDRSALSLRTGKALRVADADHGQLSQPGRGPEGRDGIAAGRGLVGHNGGPSLGAGPTNGFWGSVDWLFCRDGRWRPVEPGTFPLADGVASRVGLLRGYGNAIVAPQATGFIEALAEAEEDFARTDALGSDFLDVLG